MSKRHISILLGVAFSFAVSGLAFAADIAVKAPPLPPPVPVFSWTGFYVGGNAGGHWGFDRLTTVTTDPNGFFGTGGPAAIDAFSTMTVRPTGFIGGLQTGYNWQFSPFVVGIEGDFNWLSGSDSRTVTNIPIVATGDFETNSDRTSWLATIRPRLGTALFDSRFLIYATGGVAFGRIKRRISFQLTAAQLRNPSLLLQLAQVGQSEAV